MKKWVQEAREQYDKLIDSEKKIIDRKINEFNKHWDKKTVSKIAQEIADCLWIVNPFDCFIKTEKWDGHLGYQFVSDNTLNLIRDEK